MASKTVTVTLFSILMVLLMMPDASQAQLPRERVQEDRTIDHIFWASSNVGISTVYTQPAHNLNSTVLHTFGLVRGGIDQFFGLDDGSNTRLGIEYGITDRFNAGISRMTFNNVVDVSGKFRVLRQTQSGSMPLDLAIKLSTGINTVSGFDAGFNDRFSYFTSLMIARKFDIISVQLTPMAAHYNMTIGDNPDQLYGLGMLTSVELTDRFAISAEYLPVIGERNIGTHDPMAVALNIDTGGHVFQIFFTSSQWHNEQYIMAHNRDRFWKGNFRFGFNINRVFRLGGR